MLVAADIVGVKVGVADEYGETLAVALAEGVVAPASGPGLEAEAVKADRVAATIVPTKSDVGALAVETLLPHADKSRAINDPLKNKRKKRVCMAASNETNDWLRYYIKALFE